MNTLILEIGNYSIRAAVNNGYNISHCCIGDYKSSTDMSPICANLSSGEYLWGRIASYWGIHNDCEIYTLAMLENLPQYEQAMSTLVSQIQKSCSFNSIVFVIPAYWTPSEPKRGLLKQAAKNNNIDNVNFISVPVAVLNKIANLQNDEYVLFYDAGYKGTTISVLQRHVDVIRLVDSVFMEEVGGQNYDQLIMQKIDDKKLSAIEDFEYQMIYMEKMEEKSILIKETLSYNDIQIPVENGERIIKITSSEWRNMIASSMGKSFQICYQLLQDNHIDVSKIQKIYLYGGTCNIPYIEEDLQSYAKVQFHNNIQIVNISKNEKDAKNIALYGAFVSSMNKGVTIRF